MNDHARHGVPVLHAAYLAAVFFPFLAPIPFKTDVQPYAVVIATILLFSSHDQQVPRLLCGLLLPVLAAFGCVILEHFSGYGVRAFLGYWSLFINAAAGYLVCRRDPRLVVKWMIIASVAWLAAGLIEQFFDRTVMRALIPNTSTDSSRGVTSLATEPSFYGIFGFFMLLLSRVMGRETKYFRWGWFGQILLLARSVMGVLAISVEVATRELVKLRPKYLVILGLLCVALIWGIHEIPTDLNVRELYLIVTILNDPSSLVTGDVSVNARFDYMLYSIKGFVDSFGVPHGFDTFGAYINRLLMSDPNVIWLGEDPTGMRIMSGYGSALFELGWFGVAIPAVLTACAWKRFRRNWREFVSFSIALNVVMFSAIQLSLPLIGFLAGACLAQADAKGATGIEPVLGIAA